MTYCLRRGPEGYSLIESHSARRPLRIDFESLWQRVSRGGRELLPRAAGARTGLRVIDCTAGLGTDSFILASRGCEVTMVERSNTLYLMLEDALARAADSPVAEVVSRMRLVRGDACRILGLPDASFDVAVIDPMFPARRKRAQVKGELQMLQGLLGTSQQVAALVSKARHTVTERIVVKRPLRGGELEGMNPSGSVKGKASRFDIYAPLSARE